MTAYEYNRQHQSSLVDSKHFIKTKTTFRSKKQQPTNILMMPMLLLISMMIIQVFTSSIQELVVVHGLSMSSEIKSFQQKIINPSSEGNHNRRSFLHIPIALVTSNIATLQPAHAANKAQQPNSIMKAVEEDINTIIDSANTLDKLLSNWDKATIDCTYADVPRELLEQKNKEQLLEKASTFALFDKSTSVVSCKKTNKIVRDYIGVTGKGPLVNVDKKMLKRNVVDEKIVDPDVLDEYYTQVENFQNAISRASSLSYAAGIADLDSVNNFDKKDSQNILEENSNLEQARKAIEEAKSSIDLIVQYLTLES